MCYQLQSLAHSSKICKASEQIFIERLGHIYDSYKAVSRSMEFLNETLFYTNDSSYFKVIPTAHQSLELLAASNGKVSSLSQF